MPTHVLTLPLSTNSHKGSAVVNSEVKKTAAESGGGDKGEHVEVWNDG